MKIAQFSEVKIDRAKLLLNLEYVSEIEILPNGAHIIMTTGRTYLLVGKHWDKFRKDLIDYLQLKESK